MRIIDVIENYYNCRIISVIALFRGGEKSLYYNKQSLGDRFFKVNETLRVDIDDIMVNITYQAKNKLTGDLSFMNELIGCLVESHEPWSLHEALSIVADNTTNNNVPLDTLLSQILNTLICSHLFDKVALLLYNSQKKELRGVDVASIPPYEKEITKIFKDIRMPISDVFINKLLKDNYSPILDKDLIFEKFDSVALKNNLILSPIQISNKFYGLLVTYSANTYEDKHIFASKSSAKFLQAILSAIIVYKKYQLSILSEKELRDTLSRDTNLAALGNYAATIAHEIRNPLISIGGFAKRLLKAVNDPNLQKMAKIISNESERLERLTEDILSFAKKHEPKKTNVNLYDELLAIQMLFDVRCKEAGINLDFDRSTDLTIRVDKGQFRQVVVNLIANAVNAINKNGTISISCLDQDTSYAISITDTGTGISEENLRNLFKPFFTTSEKGTGLGLAISKKIMINHGGDIKFANRSHGAEFTLIIPK